MVVFTKNTPEKAGYPGAVPLEEIDGTGDEPLPLGYVFRKIMANRAVWLFAGAYFCTGFVRYGVDDWFPKYFQEVQNISLTSRPFQIVAFSIPFVAMSGSIVSGYISDLVFAGRRAPVAAFLYFAETILILIGAQVHSLPAACATLILVAFTCNATHSILGTAAAMDAGGRKMAGFAAGFIDSFQYWGASLAGYVLGKMIDEFGWGSWLYGMAGFGALGGALMVFMMLTDMENRHRPAS
jgi:OPA family glycerol-3-phosphate transporter-like MFS transporter